jgi:hypothetical protein
MADLYLKIEKYAKANGINNVDFHEDVVLANQGNGDFIELWNLNIPQPSLESLEQYNAECDFELGIKNLRIKRNNLLAQTDYLALSDQTMSAEMTAYRQALRDITNGLTTVADVEAVVFPTKPGA